MAQERCHLHRRTGQLQGRSLSSLFEISSLTSLLWQIPGFADIPQQFNVSLLKDAEWPNLGSIKASKGIGVCYYLAPTPLR